MNAWPDLFFPETGIKELITYLFFMIFPVWYLAGREFYILCRYPDQGFALLTESCSYGWRSQKAYFKYGHYIPLYSIRKWTIKCYDG